MPATDPSASDTDGATTRCARTTSQPAHLRDRRAADLLDRLDGTAAAHAVDEADVRHPQLEREAFGVVALGADRRVRRPAADGEVVTRDDDRAAVDLRGSEHEVGRREADQLPRFVVLADPGDRADLVEGARVDEMLDALAHRELAELVLTGDLVGTAHGLGHLGAATELVELGLPGHASSESAASQERERALEDQLDVGSAAEEVVSTRDRIELDGSTDILQCFLEAKRLVERHPRVGFAVLDEDRWRIRCART